MLLLRRVNGNNFVVSQGGNWEEGQTTKPHHFQMLLSLHQILTDEMSSFRNELIDIHTTWYGTLFCRGWHILSFLQNV
jgi:hypothetical protein